MLNYDFFNATGACSGMYVRAITSQTTHLNALAKNIQDATSFTVHDIVGIVSSIVNEIRQEIGNGNAVHIDGLGYFYPKISGEIVNDRHGIRRLRNAKVVTLRFKPEQGLKNTMERQQFCKDKSHTENGRRLTAEEAHRIIDSHTQPEQRLSVSEIESMLRISRAGSYRITKQLVEKGLLVQHRISKGFSLYSLS